MALFLTENNISFIQQYRNKWLGRQSLDFYLPDYNVGIECQGEQHFKKVYYRSKSWNEDKAQKNFINIVKRDIDKKNKCINNNVILLYYARDKYNDNDIIVEKQEIIKILNNIRN